MVGGTDIKRTLLLLHTLNCCPFCGAPLKIVDGKCDACGSVIDRNLIISYVKAKLSQDMYEGLDEVRIMDSIAEASYRLSLASEYLRSRIIMSMRERIDELRREEKEIHPVFEEISRREREILERLESVLNKQQEALRIRTVDALERAYNELLAALKQYGRNIPPEVLGLYTLPDFALEIADKYHKANDYNNAVRWYGFAVVATMYPESPPKGLPKRMSVVHIPYGVTHIGIFDGDFDGKPEVFYVPSMGVAGLKIPCVVINEGGVNWNPLNGYGVVFPIFGNLGKYSVVIFAWESSRLPDAKLISMGKEIRIIRDSETQYTLPTYAISYADIDNDGHIELIVLTGRGKTLILDSKDDHFVAKVISVGNISSIATPKLGDVVRFVAMTMDGRLLMIDPITRDVSPIEFGFRNADSVIISSGDLDKDGFDEIYVSTMDGGYRYVFKNGGYQGSKIVDGDVLGMQVVDINGDKEDELIVLKRGRGLILEIYSLRRALGVNVLEKIASYQIGTTYDVARAKMSYEAPFGSRPIFICEDIDLDGAPEILVGLEKSFLIIDPKYA